MGMVPGDFDLFLPLMYQEFGSLQNKEMLELGNQLNWHNEPGGCRQAFRTLGFKHTMVDINGKDGAIVKDLRNASAWTHWHDHFDVITNCGVTEHVEPNTTQYTPWKIIHDCCKIGGLMCHVLPMDTPMWATHCTTYYDESFFEKLAAAAGYKKLGYRQVREHNVCVLKKLLHQFPSEYEFMQWHIFK